MKDLIIEQYISTIGLAFFRLSDNIILIFMGCYDQSGDRVSKNNKRCHICSIFCFFMELCLYNSISLFSLGFCKKIDLKKLLKVVLTKSYQTYGKVVKERVLSYTDWEIRVQSFCVFNVITIYHLLNGENNLSPLHFNQGNPTIYDKGKTLP